MKKLLPACMVAAALLNSCSLLERNSDDSDNSRAARIAHQRDDEDAPPFAPQKDAKIDEPTSAPASAGPATEAFPSYEAEIARMSTKIAALETKVDVLSANLEKAQLKNSQPVIQGEREAPKSMAAPVEEMGEGEAPVHASKLPGAVKTADAPTAAVEKDFRNAMDLFQAGQNLEASNHFVTIAKKYPRHLLAAHSLYWAGEAAFRGQQWAVAKENWEDLKQNYPHSTYMPEALAGLAHVSEKEGNAAKAQAYKSALMHSFPKSPVALAFNSEAAESPAAPAAAEAPQAEATHRSQASEPAEAAPPVYQENSGGAEAAPESEAAGE